MVCKLMLGFRNGKNYQIMYFREDGGREAAKKRHKVIGSGSRMQLKR